MSTKRFGEKCPVRSVFARRDDFRADDDNRGYADLTAESWHPSMRSKLPCLADADATATFVLGKLETLMSTAWTFLVATGLVLSVFLTHAYAQTPQDVEALKKQIEALAAGQKAIEGQLREIRALLQAQTKPLTVPDVLLNVDGAPSKGDPR